jgi:hypothetical protein
MEYESRTISYLRSPQKALMKILSDGRLCTVSYDIYSTNPIETA